MDTVIVTTEEALERIIERVFDKKMAETEDTPVERTFSINRAAKMLRRSHKKISDLVTAGILKATADRRIYESSLREYSNISR